MRSSTFLAILSVGLVAGAGGFLLLAKKSQEVPFTFEGKWVVADDTVAGSTGTLELKPKHKFHLSYKSSVFSEEVSGTYRISKFHLTGKDSVIVDLSNSDAKGNINWRMGVNLNYYPEFDVIGSQTMVFAREGHEQEYRDTIAAELQ